MDKECLYIPKWVIPIKLEIITLLGNLSCALYHLFAVKK